MTTRNSPSAHPSRRIDCPDPETASPRRQELSTSPKQHFTLTNLATSESLSSLRPLQAPPSPTPSAPQPYPSTSSHLSTDKY